MGAGLRSGAVRLLIWPALCAVALVAGACATPGINHVYVATRGGAPLRDLAPAGDAVADVPTHTTASDVILGLAYDFNTDHLFLRLAPGNIIRVIERPSGRQLREMTLPELPEGAVTIAGTPTSDLAIRSRDRHLFAIMPDGRSILETTLSGDYVRTIGPLSLPGPIGGLAYDQKSDRLLALVATGPARIVAVGPDGKITDGATLSEPLRPVSLAYDSDRGHYFVPLADDRSMGEFDADGRLIARTPIESPVSALDAGPRSFLRVF
ncbi:MAG: hypothetical protein PHQ04_02740 [Opitutaceae bacterium]|nr:hypothetical protein [Opitutaceae bacterium]